MKSILTEIVLSGGSILFWALAIPAAAVAFPALALWKRDRPIRLVLQPGHPRRPDLPTEARHDHVSQLAP